MKNATIPTDHKYLQAYFALLRRKEEMTFADKKTYFNDTELRLIAEVLAAAYEGKRLISTQLAKLLGVTRSAISQIVNRLESEGVVKRVPDEVDRKIAYIEITKESLTRYHEDVEVGASFLERVAERFGEEKFDELYSLLNEYLDCMLAEREASGLTAKK